MQNRFSLTVLRAPIHAFVLLFPTLHAGAQSWEADAHAQYLSPQANDGTGFVVENAGDVDGDGFDDALVTAPFKTIAGQPNAGQVRVISSSGVQLLNLKGTTNEAFGHSAAGAGDLDGDGLSDILVGAPGNTPAQPGTVYAYSATGSLLLTIVGEVGADTFGWVVANAGDVDADGTNDLIVGAPYHDSPANNAGKAYVFSGATGALLYSWNGLSAGDRMGGSVGSAGDRNLDGHADLLVCAVRAGANNWGQAYVYSGLDGSLMCTMDSPQNGVDYGNYFGGLAGDVNADGLPDVYVIDYSRNNGRGRLFVYSGADCSLLHSIIGPAGSQFIFGRVRTGDLDGDGFDDMNFSSGQNDWGGTNAGALYIYSGASGDLLGRYTCDTPGARMGTDSAGLGDVTGDGVPDLMVGIGNYGTNQGGILIFPGSPNPPRNYCAAGINSDGTEADINYAGSLSIAAMEFRLICNGLPANTTGLFFGGGSQTSLPFGDGLRCVGGPLQRYGVQQADASGTVDQLMTNLPADLPVSTTWHVQYWYRDPASLGAGFNSSGGLRLTLRP